MIVGWGWAAGAAFFMSFFLWAWIATDLMGWPIEAALGGGVVLLLITTALFAFHAEV